MRRRMRVVLGGVLVALALVASSGLAVAAPPASVSDGTGPLDTTADLEAALHFEDVMDEHFIYGQPLNLYYNTIDRVPGDIDRSAHEGDAGLYTGAYLAAQSYRYVLAKQEIAKATPSSEVHDFWTGQLAEAKDRIDVMVAKYHLLINIAKNWQTQFNPTVNGSDPTAVGFIDFGGGIFPGEPGLLMRACHPSDAPTEFNLKDHFGPFPGSITLKWDDGRFYDCLGHTSRDQYAGATHGLTTALDLIGPHDPVLRNTVAKDIMAITDYAVKYLMNQPRPHGQVVIPEIGGNDLRGFISPLFVYTPYARMNLIQVGRNAARKIGDQQKLLRYNALWTSELITTAPQLSASMMIDATNPYDAYYKYHLNFLTGDNMIRHEPNETVRNLIRQSLAVQDASTRDDDNALFEGLMYSLTGDQVRLDRAVQFHREWLDYKANADASHNIIDYRSECGTTYECVPTNQVDLYQSLPNDNELVVPFTPGSEDPVRSTKALPVAKRRPADFLWQKDPTIIVGCGGGVYPGCNVAESGRWAGPNTDFLQVYWMLRYFTEVAEPRSDPLRPWVGPRTR